MQNDLVGANCYGPYPLLGPFNVGKMLILEEQLNSSPNNLHSPGCNSGHTWHCGYGRKTSTFLISSGAWQHNLHLGLKINLDFSCCKWESLRMSEQSELNYCSLKFWRYKKIQTQHIFEKFQKVKLVGANHPRPCCSTLCSDHLV